MSFSYLREHESRHYFQDTLETFYNCRLDIETTVHFFLHCHNFMHQYAFDQYILKLNENLIIDKLLFGNPKYSVSIDSDDFYFLYFTSKAI